MKREAFTLVELMVVLIVISFIMVALAPILTKKAQVDSNRVEVITKTQDSTPIGAIIMWYGQNIPEGWVKAQGQEVTTPELRNAIGEDFIPDLNSALEATGTPMCWIIKIK